MNLLLRRMPGGQVPSRFRLYFQQSPSERGIEHYITGTQDDVRQFLIRRLDMPAETAGRLAVECEASGTSYTELPTFDPGDLKNLLRGIKAEEKAAAEEQRGKTVQPAGATP